MAGISFDTAKKLLTAKSNYSFCQIYETGFCLFLALSWTDQERRGLAQQIQTPNPLIDQTLASLGHEENNLNL